jgi:hypothetical protein
VTYYPMMAYRTVSLEPPLKPPTGLGGLAEIFTSIIEGAKAGSTTGPTVTGAGAASPSTWCSTANPQGSCRPIAGVCLPMDASTLSVYKNLQRQANRLLIKAGKPLLSVDGRIGPTTVAGVATAMQWGGASDAALAAGLSWANVKGKPCDLVATYASQIAAKLAEIANATNSPTPPDPIASKPSQPSSNGTVVHPPPSVIQQSAMTGGLFGYLPAVVRTPLGIAGLVVGGLLIRKAMKSPGRGAVVADPYRPQRSPAPMPRYTTTLGDTVEVINEAPAPAAPNEIIWSSINIGSGRRRGGTTPYYRFGAQARSYPFDWHGWPGGTPASQAAAETRSLSGSGDLYESGLSPYASAYPPLQGRGLRMPGQPLEGVWSDLSSNERRLVAGVALVGGAFLIGRMLRKRRR